MVLGEQVMGVLIGTLAVVAIILLVIRVRQIRAAHRVIRRKKPAPQQWRLNSWVLGGLMYFAFALAGLLTGRLMLLITGGLLGAWRIWRAGYCAYRVQTMKDAGLSYNMISSVNIALAIQQYAPRNAIESLVNISRKIKGGMQALATLAATYADSQEQEWRSALQRALYATADIMRIKARVGRILAQKLGQITFVRSVGLVMLLLLCIGLDRFMTLQGEALVVSALVGAALFDTLSDEVTHI